MSTEFIVVLVVLAVVIIYLVTIYNNLVDLKNSVKKNWSNIDILLKQRNSELPKLVQTCKEYIGYEEKTLTEITKARSQAMQAQDSNNIKDLGQAESTLRLGLGKLFALAENYPDLKANNSFQKLQTRISSLEDAISDRREFYNESVNFNNIRIEQFPDVFIAKTFNFVAFDLLKFSEEETRDLNIKNLFNA